MVVETSSSATSRRGKQRKYFEQSAGARGHRYTLGKFRLLDPETRGPMFPAPFYRMLRSLCVWRESRH